jgi:predicted nucleic acid-binding protein
MTGYLVDTNCISEATKPHPNSGVASWLHETDDSLLHLSVLTLGEIRKGIVGIEQGRKRARLETWLEFELRRRFQGQILPVTEAVADRWGALTTQARLRGTHLPAIDGLLAATAIEHNLTIATRNTKDFEAALVPTFTPWTSTIRIRKASSAP